METAQLRLCRFSGLQAIEQGRGEYSNKITANINLPLLMPVWLVGSVNIHRLCAVEHSRSQPVPAELFQHKFSKNSSI
ncbi:hypothetical protein HMPREF3293_02773 [Christensenella minuta]|uniref:Uncharacterized protein n=1 Tax=Christensenella minuta TaxID=626937 RepID=A0A136Q1Y7_9FIRM|nr:hypothetical protein HMPREF3293_02773 [Christensenella minuta]